MERTKVVTSKVLPGVNKTLQTIGIESSAIKSLGGAINVDPLGETYYSATAFRYGDHVAKFSLRPMTDDLKQLAGREIDIDGRDNAIREAVQAEMPQTDACWAFCVQLCHDLDEQPIEDPTVEWDEETVPFQQVARLSIRPQDSWQSERVELVDNKMRFSVWTGLEAHRPLGRINRVRQYTYRHSADFRAFQRLPAS